MIICSDQLAVSARCVLQVKQSVKLGIRPWVRMIAKSWGTVSLTEVHLCFQDGLWLLLGLTDSYIFLSVNIHQKKQKTKHKPFPDVMQDKEDRQTSHSCVRTGWKQRLSAGWNQTPPQHMLSEEKSPSSRWLSGDKWALLSWVPCLPWTFVWCYSWWKHQGKHSYNWLWPHICFYHWRKTRRGRRLESSPRLCLQEWDRGMKRKREKSEGN